MKSVWYSVRSCIAIMVVMTVCYGVVTGKVSGEAFIGIAGVVVAHYFDKVRSTKKEV